MEKKVNLLGIRKKVILCHTKSLAGVTYTVMRPITEEDEQNLDKWECINVDGKRIDKKDIYCYGEINLSSNDDVDPKRRYQTEYRIYEPEIFTIRRSDGMGEPAFVRWNLRYP